MEETEGNGSVLDQLARDVLGRLESGIESPSLRYVGDYELEEEVARGGMGVVYRARQTSLDRPVAVKMILAGRFASAEEVARFRVEAEAAAALSHPGIVPIYEVGVHEGHHYFSMEYVEGSSLERIGNGAPIVARRAAEYALAIAEAVHYAHEHGVLHRDLKPSNILLDREGRIRVTDFGLAKRSDDAQDLTGTGQMLGTPGYMAPELADGRSGGVAAEVYGIGAILYELITGRAPYAAQTPLGVMLLARDTDPVPPATLNPRVPTDLATICMASLERSPEKRYASVAELAADLKRHIDGEPIQARPVGRVRRLALWAERHPWSISAALTLGVLLMIGVAYGLYSQTRYLQWRVDHPGEEPIRQMSFFLDYLLYGYLIAQSGLYWVAMDLARRSTGLTKKEIETFRIPAVVGRHVVPGRWLVVHSIVVLAGILYFAMLVKWTIDDFVWFDNVSTLAVIHALSLTFYVTCLITLCREIRATLHGIPPRTYTPEEMDGHVDKLVYQIERGLRTDRVDEAESLCEYLRGLYPERPEWLEMRAKLSSRLGRSSDAAADYSMAARQAERIGGYTDAYIADLEERARKIEGAS